MFTAMKLINAKTLFILTSIIGVAIGKLGADHWVPSSLGATGVHHRSDLRASTDNISGNASPSTAPPNEPSLTTTSDPFRRLAPFTSAATITSADPPFVAIRSLVSQVPALVTVGNNGSPSPAFPLALCQGDCDRDDECQSGMFCFQRSGVEEVPGCQGQGRPGKDYCFDRPPAYLWIMGNDGSPAKNFPLGVCEGDCDNDEECATGLTCMQRNGNEAVPGCQGPAKRRKDYCYLMVTPESSDPIPTPLPTVSPPTPTLIQLFYAGNDGEPAEAFPLGECQGDCDNDSDCQASLLCYQRNKSVVTVPGCLGLATGARDFCAARPTDTTLFLKVTSNLRPQGNLPLGLCEGDCSADVDCLGTLTCMTRSGDEEVHGCEGPGESGAGYCHNHNAGPISSSPTKPPSALPTTSTPTASPNKDPTSNPTDQPTATPTANPADVPSNSPVHAPSNFPSIDLTQNPSRRPTSAPTKSPDAKSPRTLSGAPTSLPTPIPTSRPSTNPSISPSHRLTMDPTKSPRPSKKPTGILSQQPTSPIATHSPSEEPTLSPTHNSLPTPIPTSSPSANPFIRPSHKLTMDPTESPTDSPSTSPTSSPTQSVDTEYYQYVTISPEDEESCDWNGPIPLPDKSNVALQFFVFADTPYDHSCSSCNTCIKENGEEVEECGQYNCRNAASLPQNNTCTFKGREYACIRDAHIPYMNSEIVNGNAAFISHCGDFLKGSTEISYSKRCQNSSFTSRQELFARATNFLLVPGDNDWNECQGYEPQQNRDWIRDLWRDKFANSNSPLNQFGRNFPSYLGFNGTGKPYIQRKESSDDVYNNPEIYYFVFNKIAVFGLNRVSKASYVSNVANPDPNTDWVTTKLAEDNECELESILIFAHQVPKWGVYTAIDNYFDGCGGAKLPLITITGDLHPPEYCMKRTENRLYLLVEAFRSGPLLVSVVREPSGTLGDFFHVHDTDHSAEKNPSCPQLN